MDENDSGGENSASALTIKSFNVNSIGKNPKHREIFSFLNKKGGDIQILVDARFSKDVESKVKEEWGSNVYLIAAIVLNQGG